jgi:hypothetical protein
MRLCSLLYMLVAGPSNANASPIPPGGLSGGAGISEYLPPSSSIILAPPNAGCYYLTSGDTPVCTVPWAGMNLPILNIGETVSFSVSGFSLVGSAWFYLGDQLDGNFEISIDPIFPKSSPGTGLSQDELDVILAIDAWPLELGKTVNGTLDFVATPGAEYYLLTEGAVRPNTDYHLSVRQVPEPDTLALFGIAFIGYVFLDRKLRSTAAKGVYNK